MSFSACDVLLNLIPALQVDILVRWLHLHDVVKLDSALCSSRHRETFTMVLGEEYCVFNNSSNKHYNTLLPWVIQRKVKVSTVDLTQGFTNARRETLFRITGKYLRTLRTSVHNFNPPNTALEIYTRCPNLEKLVFIGYDLLKEDICSVLMHLPRLQHLDLTRCNKISGVMIASIYTQGKHLLEVNLSGCQFIEPALPVQTSPVQENHTIRTLSAVKCRQIPLFLPFAFQCKALTSLYISGIVLNDVFTILTQCPALTTLSAGVQADQNAHISSLQLNTLIPLIQNLEVLHFYHERCLHWEESQIETLISSTPKLRVLFTANVKESAAKLIADAIDGMRLLVREGVINNDRSSSSTHPLHTLLVDDIPSNELESILEICPQLISLTILECGIINDDTMALMTTIGDSNIRMLDIRECEAFSSDDVLPLHNLLSLSLDLCFELKHTDLVKLLNQNPKLRKLSLVGCAYLTQDSLLYIMKKCKCLEELVFDNINTGDNYHTYARGNVRGLNTTLIEGLIRIHHPNIKLSIQLLPELL